MKGEVRVTSKLFETRGTSVVYTMDTVAKDVESRDRGLSMIAGAIAERLRKDGLTK
jgi:nitrate reductase assembly molybdenum cofactor insertion protein NarJ